LYQLLPFRGNASFWPGIFDAEIGKRAFSDIVSRKTIVRFHVKLVFFAHGKDLTIVFHVKHGAF